MNGFGRNMYYWRRLSPEARAQVLSLRKAQKRPWHSPPHLTGPGRYMVTAACYEHAPIIGTSPERMTAFEDALLEVLNRYTDSVSAWVVLPNHYHGLVESKAVGVLLQELKLLHGRTAFLWNGEDACRGRRVWSGILETSMKSDRHFWASMNYIHNNPVRHGYAERWTDWPFSSASQYLDALGREEAVRVWREFDISEMGKDWDL